MFRQRDIRRIAAATTLSSLLLAAAPALAAPGAVKERGAPRGIASAWSWWAPAWVSNLVRAALKEGSSIDPNGQPKATLDEGPGIDPDGHPNAALDAGPGFDPDGHPKATLDIGPGIDPNGHPLGLH